MTDFCKNTSILLTIISAVIFSIILTLLSNSQPTIAEFGMNSLYLVWLFILWSALLCITGKFKKTNSGRYISCVVICFVGFIIYELIAQKLYLHEIDPTRLLRLSTAVLLFLLISIRGLQISAIYTQRSQADLQTKLSALQSKIEPHFLFNSLNTIAELTHINPDHAESAIQSLSTILRSNLKNDDAFHSAKDEVILCEKYIELEKWRLGKKLDTQFIIKGNIENAIIPKLIFQPLIENAVCHGVAPFIDGGSITMRVIVSNKQLTTTISNTLASKNSKSTKDQIKGHGIAINNIRERLFVIYDDSYKIKAKQSNNSHTVTLIIPLTPPKKIIS